MSRFAMPLDGGSALARQPQKPDIERIRRERRRLETTLRQLDRRIMGERQQARRAGSTTDQTDALLRRDELKDQLLRTSTALRPERQQTTPDEVMAKRADLQRQGLSQAQGDLSRATAPIAPERVAQVRQATEAQAVAAARARQRPGGNVPALELLPSNLNRAAAGTLSREQGGAIDDATRRVVAFENFGFTPEQAAARATEANAAALRRNAERTDARSALAETFTKRDMEEAEAAERAQRIQQAQEAARIAEIQARTRAFDSVGVPEQPSPRDALELDLLREQVREASIGNQASEMLLRDQGGAGAGSLDSPEAQALLRASDQQEVFGTLGADASANVITALDRATQGAFDERDAIENQRALDIAMAQIEALPAELRSVEAQNLLTSLGSISTRDPDGTLGQFLRATTRGAATTDPDKISRRLEQNQIMRTRAQDAMDRLRQWAGTQ